MISYVAVHLALRNRVASALPAARAYENVEYTPVQGTPYVEESFEPTTKALLGLTSGGCVEDRGTYFLRWYDLPDKDVVSFNTSLDGVLALVLPGTSIAATDGTIVRIRGDQAPKRTQIRNSGGWAVSTIEIPFRVFTYNPQ